VKICQVTLTSGSGQSGRVLPSWWQGSTDISRASRIIASNRDSSALYLHGARRDGTEVSEPDKGKPPERVGRKATGLSPGQPEIWQQGRQAHTGLFMTLCDELGHGEVLS
jgi:hypothetical protein